jgi:plasmid maintenance system antidote protein VapI
MNTETAPSADELRDLINERGVKLYWVAARIGIHPTKLGQLLNGRGKLTPAVAKRIRRAVAQ